MGGYSNRLSVATFADKHLDFKKGLLQTLRNFVDTSSEYFTPACYPPVSHGWL